MLGTELRAGDMISENKAAENKQSQKNKKTNPENQEELLLISFHGERRHREGL